MAENLKPTAFAETLSLAPPESSQIKTTTGMFLSLERYNELSQKEQDLLTWRTRTLVAIRAIYRLTGISDFDEIQRRLDEDDSAFYSGVPLPISEEDKDWMVTLAHSQSMTLGDWVRKVFFGATENLKPGTAPPESPGPRCASWKEWFWKNYDASGAGFFDRKTGKLVSTEDLCKAYAEQLFAVLVTTSTTIRCELCQEAIIYKVADSGDLFFVHDRCRCARPKA